MAVRSLPTLLALLALAAPAQAARGAPDGFYGVSYDGELRGAAPGVQEKAWAQMAGSGVEAARTDFSWAIAQQERDAPFDFSLTDRWVADAAEHGVQLLPIITRTPGWAREQPGNWWPQRPKQDLAPFTAALVRRYGPSGSFWKENAGVPMRPLRHWQIYNEPGKSDEYGPVLRAAYRSIKAADKGAKVVLAGLTGTEHGTPWDVLRYQYRRGGIKGYFDVAALHMYTGKPSNVLEGVRLFRETMAQQGQSRKPIWLTEWGITASKGRTDAPRSQRTLRTTDAGMAAFLRKAYKLLAAHHADRDVRLARAYWYTWASSYKSGEGIFRFAGLNQYGDGKFQAKPALKAFRHSARR